MAELSTPISLRIYLDAFFLEALPVNAESRAFQLLWTSYAVLAMSDPALAAQHFVEGPNRLECELAAKLQDGQNAGLLKTDIDVELEAAYLLTLNHGLCTSVLVGQKSPDDAIVSMRYHLDRLFVQ